MAKFCENCGAETIVGDCFCRICGSAIKQEELSTYNDKVARKPNEVTPEVRCAESYDSDIVESRTPNEQSSIPEQREKKKGGCLKVIGVFLVIFVLIAVFTPDSESTRASTGADSTSSVFAEAESAKTTPKLVASLEEAGYSEEEAQAFYNVVDSCGLSERTEESEIDVFENGDMTTVRMKYGHGVNQINATAENHIVFFVQWTCAGFSSKDNQSIIMYDTDNVEGGFRAYYDKEENAFVPWSERPEE